MILLTCAVGKELSFFTPIPHVEMLVTGVGPIEAASSVARALAMSRYSLVINAGIAGAFEGAAQVGDGVVVSEECMELGLETGAPISLPDGAHVVERASSDLKLVDRLVERGFESKRGLTVTRVTATAATAKRLAAYGVDVETMEGFAVLRAAEMAGVPAIEVRGISNIVTDRELSKWNFPQGVRGLETVLTSLLAMVTALDD
ncbi:MAG: futalosine hydrolase [Candidatus Eremiobacteraeota bacterium]|nr:futalosine hydrolase [Candidatus Eremiobacteraeota bacterium]